MSDDEIIEVLDRLSYPVKVSEILAAGHKVLS